MTTATFHPTTDEIQPVLERVHLNPDMFNFELQENRVLLSRTGTEPVQIGTIETGDIPAVLWPKLKIKSWRLNKSEQDNLSLSLSLII